MNLISCNAWTIAIYFLLGLISLPLSAQEAVDSVATDSLTRQLKEVTVEGSNIIRKGNHDIYTITLQMRKEARNTGELLGNIPGMFYNPAT